MCLANLSDILHSHNYLGENCELWLLFTETLQHTFTSRWLSLMLMTAIITQKEQVFRRILCINLLANKAVKCEVEENKWL